MKLLVEGWHLANGTEDGLVYCVTGVDADLDLSASFSDDFI